MTDPLQEQIVRLQCALSIIPAGNQKTAEQMMQVIIELEHRLEVAKNVIEQIMPGNEDSPWFGEALATLNGE